MFKAIVFFPMYVLNWSSSIDHTVRNFRALSNSFFLLTLQTGAGNAACSLVDG